MPVTMEELSAGVQKIFRDAAGGVPFPVETTKKASAPNSETDALPYLTLVSTAKKERKKEESSTRNNGGSSI